MPCSKFTATALLLTVFMALGAVYPYSPEIKPLERDSLYVYFQRMDNPLFSLDRRLQYADTLYHFATQNQNDTLRNAVLKRKVSFYFLKRDWAGFVQARRDHLPLAAALGDSLGQAKTLEYSAYYHKVHHQIDSAYTAYFNAYQIYRQIPDSLKTGKLLLNMANLQVETHDYVGGEVAAFQAIDYFKSLNRLRGLSAVYNTLGVVYQQLQEIDSAIVYYGKAMELRKHMDQSPRFLLHTYNNLGVLETKNESYGKALAHFEAALDYTTYLETDPSLKAYLKDNYTFARFKNGETHGILMALTEALKAREADGDTKGIVTSCLHLAGYYADQNQSARAMAYAQRAEQLSKTGKIFYDRLQALDLLAQIAETNADKDRYFKTYIRLRDSLDLLGKRNREQYARIRLESERKDLLLEQQQSRFAQEHRFKRLLFWGTLSIVLGLVALLWGYRKRRKKRIQENVKKGFRNFLITKYNLSVENIEFWELWVNMKNTDTIMAQLHLSKERINDRRRSLKRKLFAVEKVQGNFIRYKAVIIYNTQWELFKKGMAKTSD